MKKRLTLVLVLLLLLSFAAGCAGKPEAQSAPQRRTLEDFQDATLGVVDGSLYANASREMFPDSKLDSYQTFTDLFQCVKQGKVDGFLLDIPNFNAVRRTDPGLSYIPVPGYTQQIGYAFRKDAFGDTLQSQMNVLLTELQADGQLDALIEKWFGLEEPTEPLPPFPTQGEPLRVALDVYRKPFMYLYNNEYYGFEMEVLNLFCQKYGYAPEFEVSPWTSAVAGLTEGRYDVLSCGIYMTPERAESVNFSQPYIVADVVMVTYEDVLQKDFLTSVRESFEKTFIRESRWKLILEGMAVTLIISVFAALGGTVLGFVIFVLARSGNAPVARISRRIARVYTRIIAGTPTLVVLMLLFYVVFGKSDIGGVIVAILGFSLTFGAFVYSHLSLTVDTVDKGQVEAAYALGFNRVWTFLQIILPQALRIFLPTYAAEVVSLVKATAVVGYIAVSDLTKMGDIIRSNTYEAFFPLIAVAVIYFILTGILGAALEALARSMDPKSRKQPSLLKGVVR